MQIENQFEVCAEKKIYINQLNKLNISMQTTHSYSTMHRF